MKQTAFISLFIFAIHLLSAQDVEWRYDRTGIYKETGLLEAWKPDTGPELLWRFDGLGEGFSSVTVGAGKLYVTGLTDGKGYLYVLDANGRLLNKKEYGDEWDVSHNGTRGSVIPNDGKLYVVSGHGKVVCFDQLTLNVLWEKNYTRDYGGQIPKYGVNESPLIVGEKLILTPGGTQHNVIAVNKNTGELIWSSMAKGDISSYCCPIYVADQTILQIVTITGHHIVGIDITDGKLLWSFPFTNRFFEHPNTPIYGNGMLLCTSSYGVGSVMLRLTDGGKNVEQAWSAISLDSRTGHFLKIGNYAYGSGDYGKGSWYCVDWKTGKQLYKDRTIATGAIIAAGDMLYCYSEKGDMALVRATPEKFDIVSRFTVTHGTGAHWAHPVIHKGVLYVRHGDTLMAYRIK
ncbi:MAG: PQQ-binding-like beta-propeller repeat protein [Cytophagaceae bacterium]|nr:PQQ-binding-like beta-propeller repeat protein [Cytophagaceae bacterium]